jgi:hypothetical protein
MLTRDRLGVTGSTGEALVIVGGEGAGAATAAAQTPVNARCKRAMWVSGKLLQGLGTVLGGSAGSDEARASELHGSGAMADDRKGEGRAGAPGFPFIGRMAWRRVQDPSGMDRLARAVVGQRRPRRPRQRCMVARRVAARRLARVGARGPSSGGGATRVDDGDGDATGRRRR